MSSSGSVLAVGGFSERASASVWSPSRMVLVLASSFVLIGRPVMCSAHCKRNIASEQCRSKLGVGVWVMTALSLYACLMNPRRVEGLRSVQRQRRAWETSYRLRSKV